MIGSCLRGGSLTVAHTTGYDLALITTDTAAAPVTVIEHCTGGCRQRSVVVAD